MDERRRFFIRPPDNWAGLTRQEQEAWSRSVVDRILGPDRPLEREPEPVEATIYLGQQRPTEPYKRSPYARPLRSQGQEQPSADVPRGTPDERDG